MSYYLPISLIFNFKKILEFKCVECKTSCSWMFWDIKSQIRNRGGIHIFSFLFKQTNKQTDRETDS